MFKGAIVVNNRGERFVDESISYKTIGDACLKQPDGVGFQVFDDRIMQKSSPLPTSNDFRRAEREGLLRKSETLQGLAAELKLDPETFVATVKLYNDGVAAGVDAEFGRTGLGSGYGERPKIEVAPFYGFPCMTSVLATYCGLAVDRSMQLLNPFGEPIPGVFAAGEVVGGLHGENYMSGSSLSKSAIFGIVAGESAARLRN
jgi:fumarate reductase flavoprotein subunit